MAENPIENMRRRVAQCQRLASAINDKEAAAILLNMAAEIESDIRAIEAQRDKKLP